MFEARNALGVRNIERCYPWKRCHMPKKTFFTCNWYWRNRHFILLRSKNRWFTESAAERNGDTLTTYRLPPDGVLCEVSRLRLFEVNYYSHITDKISIIRYLPEYGACSEFIFDPSRRGRILYPKCNIFYVKTRDVIFGQICQFYSPTDKFFTK